MDLQIGGDPPRLRGRLGRPAVLMAGKLLCQFSEEIWPGGLGMSGRPVFLQSVIVQNNMYGRL